MQAMGGARHRASIFVRRGVVHAYTVPVWFDRRFIREPFVLLRPRFPGLLPHRGACYSMAED